MQFVILIKKADPRSAGQLNTMIRTKRNMTVRRKRADLDSRIPFLRIVQELDQLRIIRCVINYDQFPILVNLFTDSIAFCKNPSLGLCVGTMMEKRKAEESEVPSIFEGLLRSVAKTNSSYEHDGSFPLRSGLSSCPIEEKSKLGLRDRNLVKKLLFRKRLAISITLGAHLSVDQIKGLSGKTLSPSMKSISISVISEAVNRQVVAYPISSSSSIPPESSIPATGIFLSSACKLVRAKGSSRAKLKRRSMSERSQGLPNGSIRNPIKNII